MFTRTAALAVLVVTLALSAPPAHADTTAPKPLTQDSLSLKASVSAPPKGEAVVCDGDNFVFCGFVGIDLVLSGLEGRERPGPEVYPWPLSTSGTVDVTRVYGCASSNGRRLHRYNKVVVQRAVPLQNRGNFPYPVPAGDKLKVGAYALLADAQPGSCPKGTSPRLYLLAARNAKITLDSQWAAIPARSTYTVRGLSCWLGSAPTPAL